jgi:hypothetical protein
MGGSIESFNQIEDSSQIGESTQKINQLYTGLIQNEDELSEAIWERFIIRDMKESNAPRDPAGQRVWKSYAELMEESRRRMIKSHAELMRLEDDCEIHTNQ